MPLPNCSILLGCAAPALSHIAAGYTMLAQQGALRITRAGIAPFGNGQGIYSHNMIVEVTFDDDSIVVYDLSTGHDDTHNQNAFDELLDQVTFYCRRSFSHNACKNMRNRRKLRPLGPNLAASCNANFLERIDPRFANARMAEDFASHNSYPAYKGLLITRLLEETEETKAINQFRIDTIKACKNEFGSQFYGGLAESELARAQAKDLVLPGKQTSRDAYLRLLHANYVCVAPKELYDTLNFAEFCAAGRAIVVPSLVFDLPGEFTRGRNYVDYASPEECVRRLGELLSHTPAIHRMEAANSTYYNMYIRPDALVRYTLKGIL